MKLLILGVLAVALLATGSGREWLADSGCFWQWRAEARERAIEAREQAREAREAAREQARQFREKLRAERDAARERRDQFREDIREQMRYFRRDHYTY
jgi:hypothetical protein